MKKGILTFSILSLLISHYINAEYMISIPLEPQNIKFDSAEVTGNIKLNPTTINRGESSNIEWNYTYADSINIEDIGTFKSKEGSVSVNPLTSRSYNVEITNGDKRRNEILNLTVIQPNQNITFSANPTRIGIGQSTQLSWDVTGASSVAIDNGVGYNLSNTDSYNISPITSTTYTLTAGGFENVPDKISSVNVEVVQMVGILDQQLIRELL